MNTGAVMYILHIIMHIMLLRRNKLVAEYGSVMMFH